MISERSTVTTVSPDACRSFSLKRIVWNAPVRAPIDPMRALEAADDPADPDKPVEVGREFLAADVAGVAGRIGERNAVLVEIICDGELAAESVPAALDVDLVDFVIARLQEDRDAKARLVDEFGNRDLVAEVR